MTCLLEIEVVILGLGILLLDLWTPVEKKRDLGYLAAGLLGLILIGSFKLDASTAEYAFGKMYVFDGLALYFKRFFLLSAVIVLIMSAEFADRIEAGISEFYALILFALAGMMFAASANDFSLLFVSMELITVTFYILRCGRRMFIKGRRRRRRHFWRWGRRRRGSFCCCGCCSTRCRT